MPLRDFKIYLLANPPDGCGARPRCRHKDLRSITENMSTVSEPVTAQKVWRLQREHAHVAWSKIFGDEPLPQLASAVEWTQWVVNERRRQAAHSIEHGASAEVRVMSCEV